jgi:hypothetical protein
MYSEAKRLPTQMKMISEGVRVVFTQMSKPSADGLWGWHLLIGDKTQSLVFGNMNNIV